MLSHQSYWVLLGKSKDRWTEFQERAAIMEFDGKLTREMAEWEAYWDVVGPPAQQPKRDGYVPSKNMPTLQI